VGVSLCATDLLRRHVTVGDEPLPPALREHAYAFLVFTRPQSDPSVVLREVPGSEQVIGDVMLRRPPDVGSLEQGWKEPELSAFPKVAITLPGRFDGAVFRRELGDRPLPVQIAALVAGRAT
jgi:hypothetical protein